MIYTKDNPKLVKYLSGFENYETFTGVVKDDRNTIAYYLNGKIHREDGPAIENFDGSKWWYLNGKRHRTDGPAVEKSDGSKLWYLNDHFHREDGPAVELLNGSKSWWLNGKCYGYNNDFTNESWIRFVRLQFLK